jgi:hypothetical protein
MNPKLLLNRSLKSFEMNFLKEVSNLDAIEIARNSNLFTIHKEGKTCFALELEF